MGRKEESAHAFLPFAEQMEGAPAAFRDIHFAEVLEDMLQRKLGPYINPFDSRVYKACVSWLKNEKEAARSLRKQLQFEAQRRFGQALTARMFNAAYREAFEHTRGRPRKNK